MSQSMEKKVDKKGLQKDHSKTGLSSDRRPASSGPLKDPADPTSKFTLFNQSNSEKNSVADAANKQFSFVPARRSKDD